MRPRGPDDLDDDRRARIRRRVLSEALPLRRTFGERLGDRLYGLFALLALPAPHIVRGVISAAVIVSIAGTATVASADALPEEPLYPVKLASEQMRLTLARTPEDRASVQLSMAEHRLAEAVRLVQEGRAREALVITSAYGTHLATAAAELASVERLDAASGPVVQQLKQRLAEQQHQAADMAVRFVADPSSDVGAQLFRTIASFAPTPVGGATVSEGIAAHAADVAQQLAAVADRLASEAAAAEAEAEEDDQPGQGPEGLAPTAVTVPPPAVPLRTAPAAQPPVRTAAPARATPRPTEAPRAAAQRTEPSRPTSAAIGATGPDVTPRAEARPTPTARPTPKPKATADPQKAADAKAAKAAAEKARDEAHKARRAAEKAKEAAKRTASPKPAPRR